MDDVTLRIRRSSRGTDVWAPYQIDQPILIVEDQESMAQLLREMLHSRWGCQVDVAHSLVEAKKRLAANQSYLVALCCDLHLSDARDGEIIDLVHQAGVPAIVLTGVLGDELRETILKKGVVDYVIKADINALNYVSDLIGRLAKNRHIKVLVVDDAPSIRMLLQQSLTMYGLNVLVAPNGVEGLALLQRHPDVRVMLVDYQMPEMDGFTLTVEARKLYGKDRLAIIGISGSADPMFSARFLKNGANDFIHKPFHYEEVICRVNQNLEMLELIEISQNAANRDFLTGLANRRYFFHEGKQRFDDGLKAGQLLAAAMIDIDHFKRINDRYGHDIGDQAIKAVAQALDEAFPDQLVARLGGEEFAVLFVGLSQDAAIERLEALRQSIAALNIEAGAESLSLTVSIGWACSAGQNLDELLRRADEQLYRAKETGRNRLVH